MYIYIIYMYIYICIKGPPSRRRFSYADAATKAGPVAAPFEHKLTYNQGHSPLPNWAGNHLQ